jgi:hypothetical protein
MASRRWAGSRRWAPPSEGSAAPRWQLPRASVPAAAAPRTGKRLLRKAAPELRLKCTSTVKQTETKAQNETAPLIILELLTKVLKRGRLAFIALKKS